VSIRVEELSKSFTVRGHELSALREVTLEVPDGKMTVVVGPSGSGKTTLLRCIAGLEEADGGRIEVGGRDVTTVAPGHRDVAMVFQDYALYPHLSVRDNIAFGLHARRMPRPEADSKTEEAARLLGLEAVLDREPGALSGGERQRVALARALVRKPEAFLLDEPLSNLDAELRAQTRLEIRELQKRLEVTTLYVTHDQVEALTMGDTVVVLRGGRIEQMGRPRDVYETPANAFVARFLGSPPMNLLPERLLGGDGTAVIGVRPERLALVAASEGRLRGPVVAVEHIGAEAVVHVDVSGERALVRCDARRAPESGAEVGLGFSDSDVHRFEGPDGRAVR